MGFYGLREVNISLFVFRWNSLWPVLYHLNIRLFSQKLLWGTIANKNIYKLECIAQIQLWSEKAVLFFWWFTTELSQVDDSAEEKTNIQAYNFSVVLRQ